MALAKRDNDMNLENRVTRLEVINENICSTLTRLEKKIDNIEFKIDSGFKEVNKKIDDN